MDVLDELRSHCTLPRVDYTDFTSVPGAGTPEEVARAAIEQAPQMRGAPAFWRMLGLRLDRRPSPDRIAGWPIADRGEDWLRIEAASSYMSCQIVLSTADGRVSLATFMHYVRPWLARLVWTPVGRMHRRIMPSLLRYGAKAAAR